LLKKKKRYPLSLKTVGILLPIIALNGIPGNSILTRPGFVVDQIYIRVARCGANREGLGYYASDILSSAA
jgi:hypothetical protein